MADVFLSRREIDRMMNKAEETSRDLPYLESGRSLIWLLAIYLRDEGGFPALYIGPHTMPTEVRYRIGNAVVVQTFRQPLGEKAMRINVPYGWYAQ